uniref:Uncharacterized protein n=1 Tax=virus sp. ctIVh9 TaxID=2826797 RepID=A0A8S5R8H0_9VIRU|nr:MAG TPA: hypothetical protein [virus sp. ctIVh9]
MARLFNIIKPISGNDNQYVWASVLLDTVQIYKTFFSYASTHNLPLQF